MAISFVAVTVGGPTPSMPTHQAGDWLILVTERTSSAIPLLLSTANGFVEVPGSPVNTGTGSTATRMTVWAVLATSSSMPAPVINQTSQDHVISAILCYRGALTTSSPFTANNATVKSSASTSATFPSVTTSVNGCQILYIGTHATDTSTAQFSSPSHSLGATVTERTNASGVAGNGGGIAVYDYAQATAGAAGTLGVTLATSTENALLTLAMEPAAGSALDVADLASAARVAGSTSILALGQTVTDAVSGARAGRPVEALVLGVPSNPLNLTDSPLAARSGRVAPILALGLARTDATTAARSGSPAAVLSLGLTRSDAPAAARTGALGAALTLGLTRADLPTPARAGVAPAALTLGLTLTDRPAAALVGATRQSVTYGLSLTDRPAGARTANPPSSLELAGANSTYTDAPTGARAASPAVTVVLSTGALTLTDRATSARVAVSAQALSLGLVLADGAAAARAAGTVPALTLGLVAYDSPSAVRLGAPPQLLALAAAPPLTLTDRCRFARAGRPAETWQLAVGETAPAFPAPTPVPAYTSTVPAEQHLCTVPRETHLSTVT